MLSLERGGPGRARPAMLQAALTHARPDVLAVVAAATLALLGLLNLDALGEHVRARHQAVVVVVGLVLLVGLTRFRSAGLRWCGWLCYVSSVVLLGAVELAGVSAYGAQRWIVLGPLSLQPSELAKLGLVLVLAVVLTVDRSWRWRFAVGMGVAAVPLGLVFLQPDLSTTLVLGSLTVAMLVLGRLPWRAVVMMLAVAGGSAPFLVHLLHPYQLERISAFLDRSNSAGGPGWSIEQAHIAIASGGFTGQAHQPLGGLLASYLPNRETDLAFASLVQQWGFLGGGLAVLAAALLVWRVAIASRHARTPAGALAAAGVAALVGVEVVVSVATNLGLMPTAGVPFPMLGYGGTTAAMHLAALGMVLGIRNEGARRELWFSRAWRGRQPRLVRLAALTVCSALLAMGAFAWDLARSQGPELRTAGLDQMTRCVRVPAPRGVITDRHGAPLAVNVPRYEVWVVPALLDAAARDRLAALVARPRSVVDRLVSGPQSSITVKVASLPAEAARRVSGVDLPGVLVVQSPRRQYPYATLLAPMLGWVGVATPDDERRWPGLPSGEIVGRAGLEQTYDPILRGVDGKLCVYVSPAGVPVAMGPRIPAVSGAGLRLTLDLRLQRRLTTNLATALRGFPGEPRGDIGGAVVMRPSDGEVLAMASLPSYDDNVFGPPVDARALSGLYDAPGHPMLDKVTQVGAPPGSTFKLVVAAADMAHPVVPPDQVVPTGGSWTLGNHTFGNWMVLPPQDLVQAIAWSNDVYFYKLAWALGPDRIISTARDLGVGAPSGIDLPGESAGYLGTPVSVAQRGEAWYPGSTVILGIGQGYLTATPLQNARWTGGVATGSVVTPHLGLAFESSPGSFTRLAWPNPSRLPFAGRLGPVRAGMAAAATSGTASILRALPVSSGAKTGSAEDPSSLNGAPDSWFSAVAPLARPAVVSTSFVRGGGHGVSTSGHVVLPTLLYFFAHRADIVATLPASAP